MTGSAYIKLLDSETWIDIYEKYGVSFLRGTYDALITAPTMKSYVTNDNRLEDGVEYLDKPDYAKIDQRTIDMQFVLDGTSQSDFLAKYADFIALMVQGGFYMKIPTLGKIFRFVYSKCSKSTQYSLKMATFTLTLIEPNPADRTDIED